MSLKIKGDFETLHGIEGRGRRWVSLGRGKPLPHGSTGPSSLLLSHLGQLRNDSLPGGVRT
jgi:hypothetical protein